MEKQNTINTWINTIDRYRKSLLENFEINYNNIVDSEIKKKNLRIPINALILKETKKKELLQI